MKPSRPAMSVRDNGVTWMLTRPSLLVPHPGRERFTATGRDHQPAARAPSVKASRDSAGGPEVPDGRDAGTDLLQVRFCASVHRAAGHTVTRLLVPGPVRLV